MNIKNLSIAFYTLGIINSCLLALLFDINNDDVWGYILLILFFMVIVLFNHLYLQNKITNRRIKGATKGILMGAVIASGLLFFALFDGGGMDSLWDLIWALYGFIVLLFAIIGAILGAVFSN